MFVRVRVTGVTRRLWWPRACLVQLAALFNQSLLRLVRLLKRSVKFVVLRAEALEALVADELLEHLQWMRRQRRGVHYVGATGS